MISIRRTLKSFCGITSYKRFLRTSVNILNSVLLNNGIRQYSTEETAVKVITFKSLRSVRKSRYNLSSWVLLLIPASAFGLGTWQVFRKLEKDKLAEVFWEKISVPAVDLPENLDELENMQFRKIRVRGKFDHSKEIYLGPRSKIDEFTFKRPASLLSISNGGFLVITPFKLSDRNLTVLINRGWVPNEKLLPSSRLEGQISEEVELIGLLRLEEKKKYFVKKTSNEKLFSYRDINNMAKCTGAAPIFLDAEGTSSVPGGPLGGQTILEFRNMHLSYIFTWYGLATLSGYMWYLKHFRKPIIVV